MKKLACVAIISVFFVSGCADMGPKQQTGGGLGAVVGAMIGSQLGLGGDELTGALLGGLVGSLVGSEIGRLLDKEDQRRLAEARQQALSTGEPADWSNPDSGNSGQVTPQRSYTSAGMSCYEYDMDIAAGGKEETSTHAACEQSDGTWKEV